MMRWLPVPSDFRGDLQAALQAKHPADRLEKLGALAQHRLGFLETIQLDRALSPAAGEPVAGFSRARLAILASSTVDHLASAIRVAGLRRNLLIDVYIGPFGQHRQQLFDAQSALNQFAPQFVLLSLTAREAIAAVSMTSSAAEVDEIIGRTVDELRILWTRAREILDSTVIQQTFLNFAEPLFGSYDRLVPATHARVIANLNDQVSRAATTDSVLVLDIARSSERDGLDVWFDVACWLQAKIEIAHQAAPMYGDLIGRIIAAQRGLSKKCLVLDLDNTLWGGVIGDDGPDGIVLGEGSGAGEAYLDFQRYVKRLGERGVILAVCSKNDAAIAEAAFGEHPEMILKRPDFAAFVANWDDKAANLELIAASLNIGLESLVFVDDNPAERARIRQSLPMVAVPELPGDIAQYCRWLADAGYFEAIAFTSDDRRRGDQYVANASRQTFLDSSQSLEDFRRGLEMSVSYGPIQNVDLARVAQLINKTNQFNPTTRRRSVQEITALIASGECLTLQFRLLDRFGNNGLVSAVILRPVANEPDALEFDTWVMSCRVFGRELEFEAMNIAVEVARKRGVRTFRAEYVPTPKNGVVSALYPTLGFVCARESSPIAGATRWCLHLDDHEPRRTAIRRRAS